MATGIVLLLLGLWIVLRTVAPNQERSLVKLILGDTADDGTGTGVVAARAGVAAAAAAAARNAPAPTAADRAAARRITGAGVPVTPADVTGAQPLSPTPPH